MKSILRRILYSKSILILLTVICKIIYDKKYLKGYYFEIKRMGWLWALKGIPILVCKDTYMEEMPTEYGF